jgi:2-polyprenyl-3-methyl-5-hydroxy-6-metoxy-1,4-benzoquinol methylase
MNKKPYHDFVFNIDKREFVGKFDEMYKNESDGNFDSWFQEDRRHLGRKIQFEILSEYNFYRILDLGCGKANFTHTLQKKNNKVTGVDISETCINIAASKYPDVDFVCSTADDYFNQSNEKFDLIITSEILSYLNNWEKIIEIIADRSTYYLVALYLPENPIGFVKSFEMLTNAIEKYFTIQHKIIQNENECIVFARSNKLVK